MRFLSVFKNKINLYLMTISLLGISLFIYQSNLSLKIVTSDIVLFTLIIGAILLLNQYTIVLPKGLGLSMDSAIYIATLFIFNLEYTLFLLLCSSVILGLLKHETVWWKHVFNFAIFSLMIIGSFYTFLLLGGIIGPIDTKNIFPYVFSLLSYFFINVLLIGLFFFLNTSIDLQAQLKGILKESFINYFITLAVAIMLAILLANDPIFGIVLFSFIMLFVSIAFRKYFYLYEETSKDKIYRQQILDSLPVGIITVDNESTSFSLNTAATVLLGRGGAEVKELVQSKRTDMLNKQFWNILVSKKICQNVKVPYLKDDSNHHLLVSQSELLDQQKELIGRIFYFIDITDTDELEKRMHQSEKLAVLGELAAGAAHEIRNPLTVIHGFLSLMKKSFTELEKSKYQIPLLLHEFDRIDTIIEEMLLMAKPGAPRLQRVYVEDIIAEIPQPSEHATVHLKIELERVSLLLDPKQMKQVFYNLFRNSSDAMNGKGTISIYSKQLKNNYQLFISDTGSGINPKIKHTIFHPFSTSKDTGTGLGLTIVQRIIENHNGKIEVYESSKNGTTFRITLPLAGETY